MQPVGSASQTAPHLVSGDWLQRHWHGRILAGGFVGKCFVQGQPFELADRVLIQGADAQVADPLAYGRLAPSSGPMCPNRLFNLRHCLCDNSEINPICDIISPGVGRRVVLSHRDTTIRSLNGKYYAARAFDSGV